MAHSKWTITFYYTHRQRVTVVETLKFKPKKPMSYKEVCKKVRRDFKARLTNKNNFFEVG